MKMIDFTPIHSYKTPCYRLYLEFMDDLFERMRAVISLAVGGPPPLPDPLRAVLETKGRADLKRFIRYYCEDRESGDAHDWFGNAGVV